ncbi:uncharacterized protein JN550_004898 [Neoarthrinium moseri]|uniref:uncharacterized protein n=1 Tax=Neoarthrinium moseri TaxID=1658444 RepID=UPI001FDDA160|nr:uncharacterized protein JN550_004898 [Neoarthrinium moseri]KAI1870752.1 hypothetical protein JN550_004898 [Neoarthrinium moseri]
MPEFHVVVRDYQITCGSSRNDDISPIRIQSPHLDLTGVKPPFLARDSSSKVISIQDVSTVHDTIWELPYRIEAHGVIVRPGEDIVRPIWAYLDELELGPSRIEVADLITFEKSKPSCTDVCWVPQLESADGLLLTLLESDLGGEDGTLHAGSRELRQHASGKSRIGVVIQVRGDPQQTRISHRSSAEILSLRRIDKTQKLTLFEDQLQALKGSKRESPAFTPSPPRYALSDLARLAHGNVDRIRNFDMRPKLDWSFLDVPDSDLESLTDTGGDDEATLPGDDDQHDVSLTLERPCCTYAALAPTRFNLRPLHRHNRDDDCPLGFNHPSHCIFADEFPQDCIIPQEGHEHCSNFKPGSSILTPETGGSDRRHLADCAEVTEKLTLDPCNTDQGSDADNNLEVLEWEDSGFGLEEWKLIMAGSSDYPMLSPPPPPLSEADDTPEAAFFTANSTVIDSVETQEHGMAGTDDLCEPVVHLDAFRSTPALQDMVF